MNELELLSFVKKQISTFLQFEADLSIESIERSIELTRDSIQSRNSKYNCNCDNGIPFSVYNSMQYCLFLYFLSRDSYIVENNEQVAEKLYLLNKILNSVDLFYGIELPNIWGAEHPLGSVMGRAKYNDYFFFYQGCTVGGSGGFYPVLGRNVTMYSNSKILGKSFVGDNVIISANSYVINETIPSNCIVFGQSPNLTIKAKPEGFIIEKTSHIWKPFKR